MEKCEESALGFAARGEGSILGEVMIRRGGGEGKVGVWGGHGWCGGAR